MNSSLKLCALLLFCISLAACSRTETTGANTSATSSSSTSSAPSAPTGEPRETLVKAVNAQLGAKSYRAQMVSSSSNGTNSTIEMEFVAPDRFHLTNQSTVNGQNMRQETIIVGSNTYMKMGAGSWQKFPVNMGEMIAQFRNPKMVEELSKGAETKFIGPDMVDGSPTWVYQYTINDPQGKGLKSTSKTWIGVTDSLPRKTESEGEMNIMGRAVNTKTSITYTDYNADIKIEPPM